LPKVVQLEHFLEEIRKKHKRLDIHRAFLYWFLEAYFNLHEKDILSCMADSPSDKQIDAIYISERAQTVFLVQSKYEIPRPLTQRIRKEQLTSFARVRSYFDSTEKLNAVTKSANPNVQKKMRETFEKVNEGYHVQLVFASTYGKNELAVQEVVATEEFEDYQFVVLSKHEINRLFEDYRRGAKPPIHLERIRISPDEVYRRTHKATGIKSYVFTTFGSELARLYKAHGNDIFEKNVRQFLRQTPVNREIKASLAREPDYFWYLNNGVTILCDDAELRGDNEFISMVNPQIINGLQTTRVLAERPNPSADLLARVIVVPAERYSFKLVNRVITATNRQNAIKQSDLMSNDPTQAQLQVAFESRSYFYERKRNEFSERFPSYSYERYRYKAVIKKTDVAKLTIAVIDDPSIARHGVEALFSAPFYARIFSERLTVDFYLYIYWLHQLIRFEATGRGNRRYLTYHVLAMLFDFIEDVSHSPRLRNATIKKLEDKIYSLRTLTSMVGIFLRIAERYFKSEAKKDAHLDIATFAKRAGLATKMLRSADQNSRRRLTELAKSLRWTLKREA
jgi:hypothetical protein